MAETGGTPRTPETSGTAGPGALFVTGMQRSGTTLLEKLLAAHPEVSLLSQPFPLLFVEAKAEFLRRRGDSGSYPLGPLFPPPGYTAGELAAFLAAWTPAASLLRELFARMAEYSGQYTRFAPDVVERALERTVGKAAGAAGFPAVAAGLWRALAHRPARLCGGKETLCEELLPALLDAGVHCLLVVRDPRDVLASLNAGRGAEFGGRPKPTLFNLRHWRKSAAFALHLEGRPGFAWLRYEDLVARPAAALGRLAGALGLAPFPEDVLAGGLRDQEGRPWQGNSSHRAWEGVSAAAVGTWRSKLPPAAARFAEAACWPELKCLGYPAEVAWNEAPALLAGFDDPFAGERPELAGYRNRQARAAEEIARRAALTGPADPDGLWLFEDVRRRLREAVR